MKKQMLVALALLLLIPLVVMLGGFLFSLINPEIAAGHPDYVRNYTILNHVKIMMLMGSFAIAGMLWLVVCYLVIRSKERSLWWMLLAALGPFGFAALAMLKDKASLETDRPRGRYERFVRGMHWMVRIGYEALCFVAIWFLAYEAMVAKRNVMITIESLRTGMSVAQILDIQNASSGMWAFSEGMEVMFLVILLYLLRPFVFNLAGWVWPGTAPSGVR